MIQVTFNTIRKVTFVAAVNLLAIAASAQTSTALPTTSAAGTSMGVFAVMNTSYQQEMAVNSNQSFDGNTILLFIDGPGSNQRFQLTSAGNSQYRLTEQAGQRCLNVTGKNLTIQTCSQAATQLFTLAQQYNGAYTIQSNSGTCLTSQGIWSMVTAQTCGASTGQTWTFNAATATTTTTPAVSTSSVTTTTTTSTTPNGGSLGTFAILDSAFPYQEIAVNGGVSYNGAGLILFQDGPVANQRFQVVAQGSGLYQLQEQAGSRCLSVSGSSLSLATCTATATAQLFSFTAKSGSTYAIVDGLGTCLSAPAAWSYVSAQTCTGATNQAWTFTGTSTFSPQATTTSTSTTTSSTTSSTTTTTPVTTTTYTPVVSTSSTTLSTTSTATTSRLLVTADCRTPAGALTFGGDTMDIRVPMIMGSAPSIDMVLSFLNWSPGSNFYTGVSYTILQASVEKDGTSLFVPVTFSGSRTITIANLATDIQADAIKATSFGQSTFLPGEVYWTRFRIQIPNAAAVIPVSAYMPGATITGGTWAFTSGSNVANEIDGTGAFMQTTGKTYSPYALAPVVLGHFATPAASWMGIGDSIMWGVGETSSPGYLYNGFFERATHLTSTPLAFLNMSVGGDSAYNFLTLPVRSSYFKYVTAVVDEYGTNDLNGGTNLYPILESNVQTIWAELRAAGVKKIVRSFIMPKTTSTDTWETELNQTYYPNEAGPGSQIDLFNTFLTQQVGVNGGPDIIFYNASVRGNDSQKWLTNGKTNWLTGDGVHPSSAGSSTMATELTEIIYILGTAY